MGIIKKRKKTLSGSLISTSWQSFGRKGEISPLQDGREWTGRMCQNINSYRVYAPLLNIASLVAPCWKEKSF